MDEYNHRIDRSEFDCAEEVAALALRLYPNEDAAKLMTCKSQFLRDDAAGKRTWNDGLICLPPEESENEIPTPFGDVSEWERLTQQRRGNF